MGVLPSGKVPFNWNVSQEGRKTFDEICAEKGYQKQAQVEIMLRAWIVKEGYQNLLLQNEKALSDRPAVVKRRLSRHKGSQGHERKEGHG